MEKEGDSAEVHEVKYEIRGMYEGEKREQRRERRSEEEKRRGEEVKVRG